MDNSLFLAQLLGLYFVIISMIVLVRQKAFAAVMFELAKNRVAQLSLGMIELVAGLGLVLANPTLSMDYLGLISLIGYMMVIESLIYLVLPTKWARKLLAMFSKSGWYNAGSVLGLVMGLYLVAVGFGIIG